MSGAEIKTLTPFDGVLKACMLEMLEVLQRYDVAALVNIASPTHGEYVTHMPVWTCLTTELDSQGRLGIRINSKGRSFASDAEKHDVLDNSVQVLYSFRALAYAHAETLDKMIERLKTEAGMDVDEGDSTITPHDSDGARAALDNRRAAPAPGPKRPNKAKRRRRA